MPSATLQKRHTHCHSAYVGNAKSSSTKCMMTRSNSQGECRLAPTPLSMSFVRSSAISITQPNPNRWPDSLFPSTALEPAGVEGCYGLTSAGAVAEIGWHEVEIFRMQKISLSYGRCSIRWIQGGLYAIVKSGSMLLK